jgi:hypothetical protein
MGGARPAGPATARYLPRPIHHGGFHVPDLRAAIDTWVTVYGAGPFYVLEHVAYDECTSSGTPAVWDHSAWLDPRLMTGGSHRPALRCEKRRSTSASAAV